MDRPQHSDLVRALKELSWSEVKQMAIHLDKSIDLALLTDIEERPIEERVMYTMKAWLDRDREASWAKVVSALRAIGKDVLARKIDEERSIPVPSHVTLHGQTQSGPPVVSPVELQPSPRLDSLHQLQPENEVTVIRTRLEPEFDHSLSVSEDGNSDKTRTTEQETSDCPTVTHDQLLEIFKWGRRSRQNEMISHVAVMAAIVGAALAAAESEDYDILLILEITGIITAMVAAGVNFFIFVGVPPELRKLAVFAAVVAVVVAILVGAGTAGITAITTARTAATASRVTVATIAATASDSVTAADRSVISLLMLIAGIMIALGAAAIAVCTAGEVLPVLGAVAAVGAVTIGAGAGVMVAAAVVSATAAIMAVAAVGLLQEAEARAAEAAVAALAVAVVTAAVGAPVLKTAAVGLAAVVAVAAAAAVAVGSPPATTLAAAVTVGTVIVAETAAVVISVVAVAIGPVAAAAAIAAVIIIAAVALELASMLNYYNLLW